MLSGFHKNICLCFGFAAALIHPVENISAATETNFWLLTSPDRQCTIFVSLEDGNLSYQVSRDRKTVINKSSLCLRRDD
jgi:hypothetical protein